MPRKLILFLDQTFPTQKSFEHYVKNLIYNNIGECDDIESKHPEHYKVLIEVLKRHPRYIDKTKNMSKLKIIKNKLNTKALEVIILNKDGTETDIAWSCTITGEKKGKLYDLSSAMRSSIEDQIFKFKKNNQQICTICESTSHPHVDHVIHFEELQQNFLRSIDTKNISIPNTFGEMRDGTNRRCFLEKDNLFKEEWVKFHDKNAKLRILCEECNLTRPKYKAESTENIIITNKSL